MRLATYNVEWFNSLFEDNGALIRDGSWSARYNVTKQMQADALGHVFRAIDADAVIVIEAPDHSPHRSTVAALENFAQIYGLRAREALIGFTNDTQQEIALLYDPDAMSARHDPRADGLIPRFDLTMPRDLDVDDAPETIAFSKPPLEVSLQTKRGNSLRLIGVHAKSKAPHGAKSSNEAKRISIENRRKQLAQCIWLRKRVEADLAKGDALLVLGDLNDGPGLDEFEELFGRSGVEIVLGHDGAPEQQLYDPHVELGLRRRLAATPVTARFFNRDTKQWLSVLLDYIMVSPGLKALNGRWRIWHPFDDIQCYADPEIREALLTASDHFPVSWDVDL